VAELDVTWLGKWVAMHAYAFILLTLHLPKNLVVKVVSIMDLKVPLLSKLTSYVFHHFLHYNFDFTDVWEVFDEAMLC